MYKSERQGFERCPRPAPGVDLYDANRFLSKESGEFTSALPGWIYYAE